MFRKFQCALIAGAAGLGVTAAPASTPYMFFMPPNFAGEPVHGGEPGILLPMPDAKPAELEAGLLWSMRAGLNVAALQCQFSPALATVKNYNSVINQHAAELTAAYATISAYFKRTGGKTWQTALDQYSTRTYNGFSTLHAQLGFCDTAASIGREALTERKGSFHTLAETRMRELRNSLVPSPDGLFAIQTVRPTQGYEPPPLDPDCYDKKDNLKKQCMAAAAASAQANQLVSLRGQSPERVAADETNSGHP